MYICFADILKVWNRRGQYKPIPVKPVESVVLDNIYYIVNVQTSGLDGLNNNDMNVVWDYFRNTTYTIY